MAIIIDGKKCAAEIKEELRQSTDAFYGLFGVRPGLAVIQVGDNSASSVYVSNKIKACQQIGFISKSFHYTDAMTEAELINLIAALNFDETIHGILVQLPLPEHINEANIIKAIDPRKDVDSFHPYNIGCLVSGEANFLPCTPAGIMELLARYHIDIAGKECVVVGRSNIVGKPTAHLLLHQNGTVTVCHSRTKNLVEQCRKADILVCAVGKPKFFTAEYIKPGAVVIDVGINRDENGNLCGDVDFNDVETIAGYITPTPGGTGPMTIAMLMKNTYHAAYTQLLGVI